jgi:hypothetical protein
VAFWLSTVALLCLLQGKIKSLEQIFLFSLAVKEYQVGGAASAAADAASWCCL